MSRSSGINSNWKNTPTTKGRDDVLENTSTLTSNEKRKYTKDLKSDLENSIRVLIQYPTYIHNIKSNKILAVEEAKKELNQLFNKALEKYRRLVDDIYKALTEKEKYVMARLYEKWGDKDDNPFESFDALNKYLSKNKNKLVDYNNNNIKTSFNDNLSNFREIGKRSYANFEDFGYYLSEQYGSSVFGRSLKSSNGHLDDAIKNTFNYNGLSDQSKRMVDTLIDFVQGRAITIHDILSQCKVIDSNSTNIDKNILTKLGTISIFYDKVLIPRITEVSAGVMLDRIFNNFGEIRLENENYLATEDLRLTLFGIPIPISIKTTDTFQQKNVNLFTLGTKRRSWDDELAQSKLYFPAGKNSKIIDIDVLDINSKNEILRYVNYIISNIDNSDNNYLDTIKNFFVYTEFLSTILGYNKKEQILHNIGAVEISNLMPLIKMNGNGEIVPMSNIISKAKVLNNKINYNLLVDSSTIEFNGFKNLNNLKIAKNNALSRLNKQGYDINYKNIKSDEEVSKQLLDLSNEYAKLAKITIQYHIKGM